MVEVFVHFSCNCSFSCFSCSCFSCSCSFSFPFYFFYFYTLFSVSAFFTFVCVSVSVFLSVCPRGGWLWPGRCADVEMFEFSVWTSYTRLKPWLFLRDNKATEWSASIFMLIYVCMSTRCLPLGRYRTSCFQFDFSCNSRVEYSKVQKMNIFGQGLFLGNKSKKVPKPNFSC